MRIFIYFFFLIMVLASCRNKSTEQKIDDNVLNEKLTAMNKILVENESKEIEKFISSHGFHTTMTGTGLRYEIYRHGKGLHPAIQDEVTVGYKLFLLDGRLVYTSDSTGPLKFRVGAGAQVKGLEEVIMLMVPGDHAHAILPAHLGFGMAGDERKIPPASALYFDVVLLDVKK